MIFFFLTNQCNLNCIHCYYPSNYIKESEDKKKILKILDLILQLGTKEIRLTGGEPLICKQFTEVIKLIGKTNCKIDITTNGTLLSEKVLYPILNFRNSIKTIWISVYGADEKDYEFITRCKGSYKLFRKGLNNLVKYGIQVGINASVGFGDFKKWFYTLSLLAAEGVSRFKILWTAPNGRAIVHWPYVSCNPNTWVKIYPIFEKLSDRYSNVEWRVEKSFLTKDEKNAFSTDYFESMQCLLKHRSLLSIDQNGYLYPCCLLVGLDKYIIGNINDEIVKKNFEKLQVQPIFSLLKKRCFHYKNLESKIDLNKSNLIPICPLHLEKV